MRESRYNIWAERDGVDYVFNGVSGSLLRLGPGERVRVRAALSDPSYTDCAPQLLEKMAHGRMLVSDDLDEVAMLAQRYRASRDDTGTFGLTIVTSLGCNFDCPYCFEDKHASILAPDVADATLAVLDDQLGHISSFHVSWFGGEPLVGKRALLELSDRFIERCDAASVDYSAMITTNGYLLDEATSAQLAARRVTSAQICLDGPPEIHDRMRPLANGGSTFWRIVENLHHAVEHLGVAVRMNADRTNTPHAEALLEILAAEGLAGRLTVYLGQIVGIDDGTPSPSSTYGSRCYTNAEFARADLEFNRLAAGYGFSSPSLPSPATTPCTAVRANELVVGSEGELYKCWDSVGNPREVIGDIRSYGDTNGRLRRWLAYDPFSDPDCSTCIALPGCMGGCAHHAMDLVQRDNRCGTFRHTYQEQVEAFVDETLTRRAAEDVPVDLQRRPAGVVAPLATR
ncbi:MAG: SPASM domain-containing protein [Acidimicrobiales bacterium]